MSDFKLLIDTNIVIGLEDPQPVQSSFAELVRLSGEHSVGLFVDGANYDDVARDKDPARRAVTLSKLAKFQQLRDFPVPEDATLVARFGAIKNPRDRCDVRLLAALGAKAVDFLVTQDGGIHSRANRAGLDASVLTVDEALQWLRQTFTSISISLPYVVERQAYQIDPNDTVFDSVRADYPGFDAWFDKCRQQHRECWILEIDDEIAGLVIRKDEEHDEAATRHPGPRILKICTFKVSDKFQGEKFGELLLKQVVWFAQTNAYDLIYLTVFPKYALLTDLLGYYGFHETQKRTNSEVVLEKPILRIPPSVAPKDTLAFDCLHYPRFYDGRTVRKFSIPIRPTYHQRLFPEIALAKPLPLFPNPMFGLIHNRGQERIPGNTIRKVYLCRAKTQQLHPGDMLFFYMSKGESYAYSQSITTVGIVEHVCDLSSADDLIRHTAKRSVFSAEELRAMEPSSEAPVKTIDFLLIGHCNPPVSLRTLTDAGVFVNRPPQSIAELRDAQYQALKPHIELGFEL